MVSRRDVLDLGADAARDAMARRIGKDALHVRGQHVVAAAEERGDAAERQEVLERAR